MATPIFCCGAECAVGHWNPFNGTGSFSTTTFRTGLRSIRTNPTASAGMTSIGSGISGTVAVARQYFKIDSAPIASGVVMGWLSSSNRVCGLAYNIIDSKWYPGEDDGTTATLGSTGVSLAAGWHSLDLRLVVTSNPWTIDVQVDGQALTQLTRALAADTVVGYQVGVGSPRALGTFDIYHDDFMFSLTSGDYPLGAGYVSHFVAVSDGTHTSTGTVTQKGTLATPIGGSITVATTDAFNWMNGVPLLGGATDNTRLICQQANGSTLYAELVMGPAPGVSTPTAAPRAVEVVVADRQASTANGSMSIRVNDNGTENAVLTRSGVAGSTSDRYTTKQYATAPTGGAWTVVAGAGNFNNLRMRALFSADAAPDQYWRGAMVEAEFAEVAGATRKPVNISQAVRRASVR